MKKIMFNDRYGLTAAVLTEKKTQTRRCEFDEAEQQELSDADAIGYGQGCCQVWKNGRIERQIPSRYKVGEVVAVAQRYQDIFDKSNCVNPFDYLDDEKQSGWTNKMFVKADAMPHLIRITNVRVDKLQDIGDVDCLAEGIEFSHKAHKFYVNRNPTTGSCIWLGDTPREAYAVLIDKVSGKGTWERNPWVFVYEFKLVK